MTREAFSARLIGRIFDADLRYACVTNLCYEAMYKGMHGVQVFPNMVPLCRKTLAGSGVKLGAVVTYPHGIFPPELKVFEAKDLVAAGADELVVAMNTIDLRSGRPEAVREEMAALRAAVPNTVVKFIIETEFMPDDCIVKAAELAVECGIDGLVTSTGLYNKLDAQKNDLPIQTTPEEVTLIKGVVGDRVSVQAQGNIATVAHARALLAAGADFLSSRFAAKLYDEFEQEG
ncbi:deoxyribose-phosphate aldolase [Pseudoflavonifractor sp. BIOML-A6]|nr:MULTISPECIES: deoxyribose-phosphate aldolase [unclassified Pseudoflavonifractor]MTQ96870.1 deoxyribose-phosphate aldolase [Pseudoflavonifractor sp. BIOML-A16]MTR05037.1 deoxyribose-phosphate aldolase [Pseudoflavonifractor sp. BIOML-A15]MTR32658.1 deoxyribose-phosphate aldolase [Pseudoflavonifractor sp. BIOML-A14]MTR72052.1 deoxyribose-phosphate aldolase [Pseudoflavonifractor sp. BIOML-A18]MTS65122.1 deoxyribose-phosphate aldolase [Pseudoflavonifractor sp. BIOML-A5]MTS70394.1 deoxyribose-ph